MQQLGAVARGSAAQCPSDTRQVVHIADVETGTSPEKELGPISAKQPQTPDILGNNTRCKHKVP